MTLAKRLARINALRKHGFHLDALELESKLFHEFLARARGAHVDGHGTDELIRDQFLAHRELVVKDTDA